MSVSSGGAGGPARPTRPSSAAVPFSRAPGPAAPCAAGPALRVAPSTSECACGTADRSARVPSRRARRCRGSAVLPPSLHLLLREAGRELRADRNLRRRQAHRLARFLFRDALHFEEHLAGANDGDPLLGRTLALAHTRFLRLLRDRLVREHAHPDLPAARDEAGHRHARRLDLSVRQPAGLERLESEIAERYVGPAPGLAGHAPALLLAVLHFLRHQHLRNPWSRGSGGSATPGG